MAIEIILLFIVTFCIGSISAALGIGGGSLIIPFLVLLLNFDIKSAIAISLFAIVSTSLAATIIYSKKDLVNFKYGSLLEIFAVGGAIISSNIAALIDERYLKAAFGIVLAYSAYRLLKRRKAKQLKDSIKNRTILGFVASFMAGIIVGLLGIGGGVLKVPVLILILGLPIKTAIATSEFMISITSSTAALTYYAKGYINPYFITAAISGSFIGASVGSTLAVKTKPVILKVGLAILLAIFSILMLLSCLGVKLWL